MALVTAGFETGVNGNNISTGDAGNTNPWNAVAVAANGSAKYDNAQVKSGALAGKFASVTGSPCTAYVAWTTALGLVIEHYGRAYVYNGGGWDTTGFIRWFSGGGPAGGLYLTNTYVMQLRDTANVTQATTTNPITLNAWTRIEWHVLHSNTVGQITVRLFLGSNVDGTVANEELATAANLAIDVDADEARYGIQSSDFPITVWLDGIVEGASDWVGPTLGPTPVALFKKRTSRGISW